MVVDAAGRSSGAPRHPHLAIIAADLCVSTSQQCRLSNGVTGLAARYWGAFGGKARKSFRSTRGFARLRNAGRSAEARSGPLDCGPVLVAPRGLLRCEALRFACISILFNPFFGHLSPDDEISHRVTPIGQGSSLIHAAIAMCTSP